jgi:hypothetical protein
VQVITTNNDGTFHLGGKNNTFQDTTTNGHVTGERALLVNILTLNSSLWGLETKTNFLVPTWTFLLTSKFLAGNEDTILLLESFFVLQYSKPNVNIHE